MPPLRLRFPCHAAADTLRCRLLMLMPPIFRADDTLLRYCAIILPPLLISLLISPLFSR